MHFGITFDYLCPFTRNAHEAVLNGVDAGKDWHPRHVAFSLVEIHLGPDDPHVWENPDGKPGVLALQWAIATRDHFPEAFPAVHRGLFTARHDHGQNINDPETVRRVVSGGGVDPDAIAEVVASGAPLRTLADEHTEAVETWQAFGTPTFLLGNQATFIRFMSRGDTDDLERALDLLPWTNMNEFKRTTVPR